MPKVHAHYLVKYHQASSMRNSIHCILAVYQFLEMIGSMSLCIYSFRKKEKSTIKHMIRESDIDDIIHVQNKMNIEK